MRRNRNAEWTDANNDGSCTWDQAKIAVLMDIREQLQYIAGVLRCSNFQDISRKLERIARQTKRRRKKPLVEKPNQRIVSRC